MSSEVNCCSQYNVFRAHQLCITELLMISFKTVTLHEAITCLSMRTETEISEKKNRTKRKFEREKEIQQNMKHVIFRNQAEHKHKPNSCSLLDLFFFFFLRINMSCTHMHRK